VERTLKKNSAYLLAVEQMAEDDYPVLSYLADVFQLETPGGWIEMPQVAAGRKPSHGYGCMRMAVRWRILSLCAMH
jgi:hypothetical protein